MEIVCVLAMLAWVLWSAWAVWWPMYRPPSHAGWYRKVRLYKYQVCAPVRIDLRVSGHHLWLPPRDFNVGPYVTVQGCVVHVAPGYAWDGTSGPTLDTHMCMVGSLVHDILYQAIRAGTLDPSYRKTADDVMYDLFVAGGLPRPWAWVRWAMCRAFGGYAIKPGLPGTEEDF